MEIRLDNRIRHQPNFVHNHAQSFRLEAMYDFHVGSGSRTQELYSVSADWCQFCFTYAIVVACGEFWLVSK
jgi:hypothetical protein